MHFMEIFIYSVAEKITYARMFEDELKRKRTILYFSLRKEK